MNVGDRVNYTATHLQQIGMWMRQVRAGGVITGYEGRFVLVHWAEDEEPTACAPEALCRINAYAGDPAKGFSPEYGNWDGCDSSKVEKFRKLRARGKCPLE